MSVDTQTETAVQLATIKQAIEQIADGKQSLDEIETQLRPIWESANAAGDGETCRRIELMWTHAEHLAVANVHTKGVADAALNLAGTLAVQRDAAAEQFIALHKAAGDGDDSHPVIRNLMNEVEEDVYEFISQAGGMPDDDTSFDVAYENITWQIDSCGVGEKAAARFANYLLYVSDIKIEGALMIELGEMIERVFGGHHPEWKDGYDE
jgi:hypothetical protein